MAAPERSEDLSGYKTKEKLDLYLSIVNDNTVPAVHTKFYNLYLQLPDLKDKIVLDLPCGMGRKCRQFVTEFGAKKVIGVDIVDKQIELANIENSKAEIEPGKIEYFCHNATEPKQVSETLSDYCISAHLFCYAKNFKDLIRMFKFTRMNLKQGGIFYAMGCSLAKESVEAIKTKYASFGQPVVHVDAVPEDQHIPRKLVTKIGEYTFNVLIWDFAAISEALHIAGFSKVELRPYVVDPDCTAYDMSGFLKLMDGNIVVATS